MGGEKESRIVEERRMNVYKQFFIATISLKCFSTQGTRTLAQDM